MPHLPQALIVDKVIERRIVEEGLEVFFRHVDAFEDAFANGDARHDDDEFLKPVSLVQLENRAEINKVLPVPVSISIEKSRPASAVTFSMSLAS